MRIRVQRGKVVYDLDLRRSVSVIKGNSGSGKSLLVKCVSEYMASGVNSAVTIECERKVECILSEPPDYETYIKEHKDSVIILDKNIQFNGDRKSLLKGLKDAGAWLLLISRKDLECAADSVYHVKQNGDYRTLTEAIQYGKKV